MARISGVNIPKDKRVEIALTYIYGVGLNTSRKILKGLSINLNARVKDLAEEEINKLRQKIEGDFKIEGELRRECLSNIKRLKEIKAYRGTRHAKGLPVKGQRTKTNSRTVRGNRRVTMGSGRAPSAQKT
ncbi:MAG: 30S ribosomal protein S13 [Candidatus Komeilibacteria bacterium CG11_big_fil_rev_8_21_14_0_20_36_20]|uniref:Small ribosomal subunit protein uS13 n=1 Tax=Candidatus Komeilibacteria bacterium CG11_big_fil_rev_8_21_14_0_20_36_20 TaxID=1974477 RepID=A0A2H0NC30_9BACT|nr:MAG: 30S ribosomal protein S13 [Candidatus Komeilibacteria bacterium CG11_big_fil_rev_8_21_14_0_20_36_20]PIR81998.1 MAG: 30S ribosomal protein S13 [Candidatus Komeilibacteria bacterium CG10_big_fil_rev_8_21_14_0_10_36_65]PJC55536.1 MAG: 30S ribosomal protein S13 [Candidatus Komeilibacteria bacterium CG_4_9_14_0_2_um_filter_36_13]